jgi:hypothetical protein
VASAVIDRGVNPENVYAVLGGLQALENAGHPMEGGEPGSSTWW